MKCPHDKILVRFTQKDIDAIFFSTVQKDDGSTGRLEVNVPAQDIDDRAASLFVNAGIVVAVGRDVYDIRTGDIALLSYELFNDERKLIKEDEDGRVMIVNPVTTYHAEDNIAFGNQQNPRNQLVWESGEIDEVSQLLGIIRDGELIANEPYCFLNYQNEEVERKITGTTEDEHIIELIKFSETPEIIERQILCISKRGAEKYEVKNGDNISIRLLDTFSVKVLGRELTCCNDSDLLLINETV